MGLIFLTPYLWIMVVWILIDFYVLLNKILRIFFNLRLLPFGYSTPTDRPADYDAMVRVAKVGAEATKSFNGL